MKAGSRLEIRVWRREATGADELGGERTEMDDCGGFRLRLLPRGSGDLERV